MTAEFEDPRWHGVFTRDWRCASCASAHRGLFDLASRNPEQWPDDTAYRPNGAAADASHILTEDFCILNGEHYFVRCILELPLIGAAGERFAYGIWSTLSKPNFERYMATFDDGEQGELGPWFGWFSNRLKGYPDTLNIKCNVHPQNARQRPVITLQDADHPLAMESRDGITFDRLREIFALHGHAMLTVV